MGDTWLGILQNLLQPSGSSPTIYFTGNGPSKKLVGIYKSSY